MEQPRLPETPQCTKLSQASAQISAVREFLEMLGEKGIYLAEYSGPSGVLLHPIMTSKENLIMEFFEIDTAALEAERRALLEHQRQHDAWAAAHPHQAHINRIR